MTFAWPMDVLRPRAFKIDPAWRSTRGAPSINGKTQVVSSDAGIWVATLGNIDVRGKDRILAFRGISTQLEGMLNPILIPLGRAWQPYHPYDTHLYDEGQLVIDVVAAGSVGLRGVQIAVTVNHAEALQAGQHFSVNERLYRVRSYNADTHVLTFRPPLREAIANGTRLEFDNPGCRMKLASDGEMDLDLQMLKAAEVSVNFVEDL